MRGGNCPQCFSCHLVPQLKATPPFCLALVLLEREVASNSQQSAGCSVSTKVTQNLPPVLMCQDKSADCSPFMQEFPENFTASRHRKTLPAPNAPNRLKLPTLQVSQNPLKRDSQRSQETENGRFSVHPALSNFTEQFSLVLSSVTAPFGSCTPQPCSCKETSSCCSTGHMDKVLSQLQSA